MISIERSPTSPPLLFVVYFVLPRGKFESGTAKRNSQEPQILIRFKYTPRQIPSQYTEPGSKSDILIYGSSTDPTGLFTPTACGIIRVLIGFLPKGGRLVEAEFADVDVLGLAPEVACARLRQCNRQQHGQFCGHR
ncbi:predicted protein [Histoplasma mississippiense (nom. inval.)]|uniref:predicted protein n=1 Tax=Ajellomyces capsulatus (strain NAm1 / WU24) TaxID=2059318 RepID=UPI000157CBB6|nr:predicted protein [Histoplasma mississippiense (nom. inval.)]EDN10047.1 predicted protein [Histoplasma mississippiense (nom. inval.)]